MDYDVIIVGGGLAGLSCARELQKNDLSFLLLEAEDRIGGRVQTKIVDGFRLDHGFQVLQTAYPEAGKALDYGKLNLKKFPAGVIVRANKKFQTIADPRSHPGYIFTTATSSVGTFKDRLKMWQLTRQVASPQLSQLFDEPEQTTLEFLEGYGFTEGFIRQFFVPFFAGASLDRSISASSRVLKYIFRVFATGDAALPALGMEEIPRQLRSTLPDSSVQTNTRVSKVGNGTVTLEDETTLTAKIVVIATALPVLEKLLGMSVSRDSISEYCICYAADWRPPLKHPFLILNGEGSGIINNIAFPSLVAPEYSPDGRTLISAVALNTGSRSPAQVEQQVREQLTEWFGNTASSWQHLHTFQIPHALPDQKPPTANPFILPDKFDTKIRICGEYNSLPGIQWALLSGRMAAEAIIGEL